jgi:predicted nucleotidyltransferase
MSLAERSDIEDFVDRAEEALGERLEDAILFGSYARDEHVPGSDIDIALLVAEIEEDDEQNIWNIVGDFQEDRDLYFSPKLYRKDVFEEKVEEGYSFYTTVSEEGVEL